MKHGGKNQGQGNSKIPATKTAPDSTNPNSGYNTRKDLAKGWTGGEAKPPKIRI